MKSNEKPLSVEDKIAVEIIENTTRCVDGRYEVGMLWKEKECQCPNNVAMAKHRLQCLRRRLRNLATKKWPLNTAKLWIVISVVGSLASCQKKS